MENNYSYKKWEKQFFHSKFAGLTLLAFKDFEKLTEKGFIKYVIIVTVDGGPDTNPRY